MKLITKPILLRIIRILKWSKIIAKFTAIGTTVSGAVAALSGSATTGIALSAAGATTYAATKGLPQGYEKTKHVPPGRVDKAANMLRHQEISANAMKATKQDKTMRALKAPPTMLYSGKQVSSQRASGISSSTLIVRKK